MPIKFPRIEGTTSDSLLNKFMDSVNHEQSPNLPKLTAYIIAAISRFLIENQEFGVGALHIWKDKSSLNV